MNRIVLDAELREKLNGGKTGVEFTDETGNVVGRYLTKEEYNRLLYDLAWQSISQDEIAEARGEMLEQGGVDTGDLLAALDAAKREWEARR